MQRNQFFYTISEVEGTKVGGSFNLDMVIRSAEYEVNKLAVLLNDWHTEPVDVPQKNKQGVITGVMKQKQEVNSVIYLNEEDSTRFRSITEIGAALTADQYEKNVREAGSNLITL